MMKTLRNQMNSPAVLCQNIGRTRNQNVFEMPRHLHCSFQRSCVQLHAAKSRSSHWGYSSWSEASAVGELVPGTKVFCKPATKLRHQTSWDVFWTLSSFERCAIKMLSSVSYEENIAKHSKTSRGDLCSQSFGENFDTQAGLDDMLTPRNNF